MTDKAYSLDELNRFLDYAADKGLIKSNTANSRKLAANKILGTLDPSETTDLRNVDIDSAFNRFQNRVGTEYKPDSLQVYRSRVKSALADFFSYRDNPSGFKPNSGRTSSPTTPQRHGSVAGSKKPKGSTTTPNRNHQETIDAMVIPIPIREGLTVTINNLPPDLSAKEAGKIAAVVKAYALADDE